jgi:hypothetical protein
MKRRHTTPIQLAPAFVPNSWYDALLAERESDRARFETRYSAATQQAVAAYELAKLRALQAPQCTTDESAVS